MTPAPTDLRTRLEDSLAAIDTAARDWGVRPDKPEGKFVAALRGGIKDLADVVLAAGSAVDGVATDVKHWVETARETADAAARRAEASVRKAEIKQDEATSQAVERLVPGILKACESAVVLRAKHRGRWLNLGWATGGAVVTLCLLGTGAWLQSMADQRAVTFYNRCLGAAIPAEGNGKLYCSIEALSDQAPSNQPRR